MATNTIDLVGDATLTARLLDGTVSGNLYDSALKTVGVYAFYKRTGVNSVEFPSVTAVSNHAFQYCTGLRSVNLQEVATLGASVFADCTALTTVSLPNAATIGSSAFAGCTALTSTCLPNATTVGITAFQNCTGLTFVDLPLATRLLTSAFEGCSSLKALALRGSTVCSLSTGALTSTAIASGTGYIYVPSALLSTYQAATNWSTYSAQFRALEDYTVDGTTTGELSSDAYISLASASWAKIAAISEAGEAANYFSVGERKQTYVTYESGDIETIEVAIAGFDHDDLADGSGTAGMSFIVTQMPSLTSTFGNRATALSTLEAALPDELTAVIKSVSKENCASYFSGTDTTYTSATLWLPSLHELGHNSSETNAINQLGEKYDLFTSGTLTSSYLLPVVFAAGTTAYVGYLTRQRYRVGLSNAHFYIKQSSSGGEAEFASSSSLMTTERYLRFGFCV